MKGPLPDKDPPAADFRPETITNWCSIIRFDFPYSYSPTCPAAPQVFGPRLFNFQDNQGQISADHLPGKDQWSGLPGEGSSKAVLLEQARALLAVHEGNFYLQTAGTD